MFIRKIIEKIKIKKTKEKNLANCYSTLNGASDIDYYTPPPLLYSIFMNHKGYASHKWEQYLHIYHKLLTPYVERKKPIVLLEIGVQNGGSLQIWKKFLPQGSRIIGLDIDERVRNLLCDDGIEIIVGDASNPNIIDEYFKDITFDIIIDDASHICDDVINTFEHFLSKLNFGGKYIIEDVHTSYWSKYNGGLGVKHSTMEYFKNLLDSLNYRYISEFPYTFPSSLNQKMFEYNKIISNISFWDSVIVIEKYLKLKQRPFKNYITRGDTLIASRESAIDGGSIECNETTKFERLFDH